MTKQFLHEGLDALEQYGGGLSKEIPNFVKDNLNPKFEIRLYQKEAFSRFFHCFNKDFPNKKLPLHLLFNMATGSGKTLIMAGLILYLYKKGYRNFLFFVNSTNIIEKTKNNFLNPNSSKYLFNQNIVFDTKKASIDTVENFEGANENNINICFTTIQKLHSDLTVVKENSLTYEDFKSKKIVLLSDEAHHISAKTKQQMELNEKPTWENTVEKIFNQNQDNLLLEFTATLDYEHKNIISKYRNKVLYRYDLRQFRNDGWSKDVYIVQADFEQKDRILQAIILNQYKQEVATKYCIPLKPVILFKAQKTIEQNKENKKAFHKMIESLTGADILRIKKKSNLSITRKAFAFFESQKISCSQLVKRLREEFQENRCLSVNEEAEKEKNQILLNTLEDEDNLIRAVFAVEKLNEGWDVLNLFDIVRCYETRDSGKGKIGKTTMKEAQLIGRGARYFPFVLSAYKEADSSVSMDNYDNPYKRKFDENMGHELRILEELHYHSINDNKYISEITQALIETGIMEEKQTIKQLKLKEAFQATDFYEKGLIYINKRVKNEYDNVRSLFDMGVSSSNYHHKTATGKGVALKAFPKENGSRERGESQNIPEGQRQEIKLKDMPFHIRQNALSMNNFFTFQSLKKYFPQIQSIQQFMEDKNYLGGEAITFHGTETSNKDLLKGILGLLEKIKNEIRDKITKHKGTENFEKHLIKNVFNDKEIKLSKSKLNNNEGFISDKNWYVFKAFYGTSEEKAFVKMLDSQMNQLREKYDEIYLIRNEKHFTIYNFDDGQGFEPDFVLFLKQKEGKMLTYQMFIEPKGKHLKQYDKWKEDFLNKIRRKFKGQTLGFITGARSQKYRLTAAPFYNNEEENQFKQSLYSALSKENLNS